MKNLPVGRKLFVSFGIVVLLMVVILAVTVFTSLDRNNKMEDIANITDMQSEANNLLNDVNSAWVELRTVFTTSDYTTEYDLALQYLDSAEARIDALDGYTDAMDPEVAKPYVEANALMRTQFASLRSSLELIYSNDQSVLSNTAEMLTAGDEMGNASSEMRDLVHNLLVERLNTEPDMVLTRLQNILAPSTKLSEDIDAMRMLGRGVVLTQSIEDVPEILSMISQAEADLKPISDQLVTDAGMAASSRVATTLANYRTNAEEVVTYVNSSEAAVADAREQLNALGATVNGGVTAIGEAVNADIANMITTSNSTMLIMIIIVVIAVLVSVVLGVYITRAITGPLDKMRGVLVQAGTTGDLAFSDEVRNDIIKEAAGKDELGQSIKAFAAFVDRVRYIADNLEAVANRDLTVEVDLLGDRDTMGLSLKAMIDNLNDMFSEINSVSSQVATSSGEIAVGAQSLAQGSTEQASTVEEISASINEINEQSKVSVNTASEAATYGETIRQIAQDGNDKMGSMMQAVQEINDASQAIGQVIKVIDDIAFQTNILALNAAVEAARAGEHGKGFAVVADEVRNLAGKSADAAKETSTLISANIQKAELGLSISQETAESLGKIVEGIQQTSESLKTVAEQAEGSQAATAQVNLAVDQVAQVVQQNSATSEESAAASEEMSSQAQVLQQLIAQFKLKGSSDSMSISSAPQLPAAASNDIAPTQHGGDIIF